jgi:preprotein translocase subunit SecE
LRFLRKAYITPANKVKVIKNMLKYFRNVATEMKRVTWLSQEQASKETVTVITVSVVFALFLGGVDWLLQSGFNFILN